MSKLIKIMAFGLVLTATAASAAPKTYAFEGEIWGEFGPNKPAEWAFAAGQKLRGTVIYDADRVAFEGFRIEDPNWTLVSYHTPIVSFSYEIETANGLYKHDVPTQNLSDTAWQYAAVAKGASSWDGVDLRMMNYPQGWRAGPPSAPLPQSAYVGNLSPHNVNLSLFSFGDYVLPELTPDLDLASVFANTGGEFSVRFSDSYLWPVFVERVDASVHGRLTSLRLVNAVPEPATWAMMIFGFGATGQMVRRRSRPASRQGVAA